ncbi:hypothetical protein AMK21_19325 [Streptomyces sp. CB00316]|uniref:hypothetical protein n=1 Tax=unclassified Streptomyces TaxID=2593676 RepID=UPI00093B1664|nr:MULTISPECIES: hypothetical protein [unclassified Streptomyces]MBT2379514.1 hypothetical protein [Streptomyces sp. ISL-111]OKJ19246.1 hypothetical protein AMK21_19325 [Streptomyces sp. CB00316]
MRTNRVLLAATASILAFALTGCGGDDGGAKVPSAGGASTSASARAAEGGGEDDLAGYVKGQREWVKCMRDNGIDVPDPDETGQVDFSGQGLALKKDPKFMDASEKCSAKKPAVPESVEAASRPKLTPEQIKTKREYAECMQKNGAQDFPDPGPDGYGGDINSGAPEWDQSSAGAQRATRTCAPIIGAPTNPSAGKG